MRMMRVVAFAILLIAGWLTAYSVQAATFPITGEVHVQSTLNMRTGPSTEAPVIASLANRTSLQVLSQESGWYKVSHNDQMGYVKSEYVSLQLQGPSTPNKQHTIVIDAGHGGIDNGASGTENNKEKDMTLTLSNLVKDKLEKKEQFTVVTTRDRKLDKRLTEEGRKQELSEKVRVANNTNADLFVSIHYNSGPSSAHGTETYHYESEESKKLSEIIHKHLVAATGFTDRGMDSRNLYVLRNTKMPATLLEIGFISNPQENREMRTPEFQERVAQAIADGITEYCTKR